MDLPNTEIVAWYGAVVATLALLVNFFRLRHQQKSTKPKLEVEVELISDAETVLQELRAVRDDPNHKPWDGGEIRQIWTVVIRNTGAVTVFLDDAGLLTKPKRFGTAQEMSGLVATPSPGGGGTWLVSVHESWQYDKQNFVRVLPGSTWRKCGVYLKAEKVDYRPNLVTGGYAKDQNGRRWTGRYRGHQI